MMYYISEKGIYVNEIEDIRDLVSEDIFRATENIMNEEIKELNKDIEHYKEQYEFYEARLDEATTIATEQQNEIEALIEYLTTCKRINKQQIINSLKHIEKLNTDIIDS